MRDRLHVKDVARITGVSIRTLHHYDAIGLVSPSGRTEAGYRLYARADLARLHRVLVGRALGLGLSEIQRALDEPGYDARAALERQRDAVDGEVRRLERVRASIDRALAALGDAGGGEEETMASIFDGLDDEGYADEAERRWGDTPEWAESRRRVARYRPEELAEAKAELAEIHGALAAARAAGEPHDSARAMDLAERARLHVDRWFYPCSHSMHAKLAELYEADPRFAETIDRHGAGLTGYLAAAIRANARRGPRMAVSPR